MSGGLSEPLASGAPPPFAGAAEARGPLRPAVPVAVILAGMGAPSQVQMRHYPKVITTQGSCSRGMPRGKCHTWF